MDNFFHLIADSSGFGAAILVFYVIVYFVITVPQYLMAQKMGDENPWYAFVPILNVWQLIQLAGLDWYWILICLIPCVGFIAAIYITMKVAEEAGKPMALGLLTIIPLIGFPIFCLLMAYS